MIGQSIFQYLSVTGVCVIFEIVAAILVWKIAGGDELQSVLSKDIEKHIDNMNVNYESRRFLDIIQLKVSKSIRSNKETNYNPSID